MVRDFDGPCADERCEVKGAFEHNDFVKEMQEHGVPASNLVAPRS
jgi:hypothetical protein